MPGFTGTSAILGALLSEGEIRYGEPDSFSGLTLIPLFTRQRAPFDYVLLARAVESGDVTIEEVGGGIVPALRLVNRGYLKHFRCQSDQTGILAAVGGQAICADLFDRPETLAGLWDRLIPSYAVEAMARSRDAGTVTAADGEVFVRGVLTAAVTNHPAIGRGTDLRITGAGLVGAALAVEDTILHLALFRTDGRGRESQRVGFASVDERRGRFASR